MKNLIDFLPILLFFIAYYKLGSYAATAVLMLATVLQMTYLYFSQGKLSGMHKATLVLILFFGALTLWLQDFRFLQWKSTVLYAAMGLAMLVAWLVFHKNAAQALLGKHIQLPDMVWTRLNIAWVSYTFFMAAINAYVVSFYSESAWVNFKLWGYAFPVLFLLGQGLYVMRYLKSTQEDD